MRLITLILSLFLTGQVLASSYDSSAIVKKNSGIAKRFDFLKKIELKKEVTMAIIGDYIHTDAFSHIIRINNKEQDGNFVDDDNNGYEDDYFGMNFNDRTGRLYSPVATGHENGITSLVEAFITDNNLSKIKIIPINVTADTRSFDELYMKKVADAIDYARLRGAQVISMSIGVDTESNSFFQFIDNNKQKSLAYYHAAVKRAQDKGILMVGSASNNPARDLVKEPVAPANSTGVISVGNVNFDAKIQSAYGANIDLAWYGTGLYAWYGEKDGYRTVKGSSYSTPLVALTLAVAKSLKPDLSFKDANLFRTSCEKTITGSKNIKSKCVFSPEKLIQKLN